MGIEIKLIKSCQDLEPYLRSWKQLAIDALEPNPFYESWCLLPAVEFLSNEHKPWYILGFNQDEANQDNRLILFFPIIAHSVYKHLPVKHLSLWSHIHCFLHTPLVAKGFEHSVIAAFFTWLVQTKRLPKTMLWKRISGDGPFFDALKSFLFSHPEFFYHEESYRRAKLVHAYPSYEEHLAQFLPKKKIKACIHRYDHLAELGKVTYEQKKLTESDLDAWGEDFLKIEGSGWKGRSNTALRCDENQTQFFKKILLNGINQEKIDVSSLRLNQQLIAASLRFLVPQGSYGFKTAYDEEYAKYGPGILMLLETIKHFYQDPNSEWLDSCTDPLSSREFFFSDRKTISTVITSLRTLSTKLLPLVYSFSKSTSKEKP